MSGKPKTIKDDSLQTILKVIERYNTLGRGGKKIVINLRGKIVENEMGFDRVGVVYFDVAHDVDGNFFVKETKRFYMHPAVLQRNLDALLKRYSMRVELGDKISVLKR